MAPVRHDRPAVDHDVGHVRGGGREDGSRQGVRAGGADAAEVDRDQVGAGAGGGAWPAVGPWPSSSLGSRNSAGEQPYHAWHASFSARCSERCTWNGCFPGSSTASAAAGTARTECAAYPITACGCAASAPTRSAQALTDPSPKRICGPLNGAPSTVDERYSVSSSVIRMPASLAASSSAWPIALRSA